jgi:hypothetical protein
VTAPALPRSTRRRVKPHPVEQLDAWAALAGGDFLLNHAARVARIRLEFSGRYLAWQVRLDMIMAGLLDGTEGTDCFGALHRRLDVIQCGRERVPTVLPAEFMVHGDGRRVLSETVRIMERVLADAHGNLNSCWRRMTPDERAAAGNRKLG